MLVLDNFQAMDPSSFDFSLAWSTLRHIRLAGQPFTLSRTAGRMAARAPEFGEQTDDILGEFGFTADEISRLRDIRLFKEPPALEVGGVAKAVSSDLDNAHWMRAA